MLLLCRSKVVVGLFPQPGFSSIGLHICRTRLVKFISNLANTRNAAAHQGRLFEDQQIMECRIPANGKWVWPLSWRTGRRHVYLAHVLHSQAG
jgi:hypothetical protein